MVIYFSSILLSIALAIVGPLTFWPTKEWYDFYIPIVLFIAGIVGMFIFWFASYYIIACILSLKKNPKKISKLARFMLVDAMRCIDIGSLSIVKVVGKDLLPKKQRFLFVQNHTSRFDPMITNGYFPFSDIAFITKPGNYKIPIANKLMPRLFYQAIDREDPIQSLGVIRNSIELINNDVTSIGVYPEGMRHLDNTLGEFHEGVFNICLKAHCPLVVSVIKNAYKIRDNFPLKCTKVTLEIVKVIPYEEMEGKTAKALSDEVHALMLERLQEK